MSKTNPYASFATSKDFEVGGIWLEEPDFRIKIRRAGGRNKAYQKSLERHFRKHRRAIDLGILDEKIANPKLVEVFIESIICGWEVDAGFNEETGETIWEPGMHDPNTGEVVPFTEDTVRATLANKTFGQDLFSYIREQSSKAGLFLEDIAETDVKN